MAKKSYYGVGDSKTVTGKGGVAKANVTAEQLKASGHSSLRGYMNAWNKAGTRPTAGSGGKAKAAAPKPKAAAPKPKAAAPKKKAASGRQPVSQTPAMQQARKEDAAKKASAPKKKAAAKTYGQQTRGGGRSGMTAAQEKRYAATKARKSAPKAKAAAPKPKAAAPKKKMGSTRRARRMGK